MGARLSSPTSSDNADAAPPPEVDMKSDMTADMTHPSCTVRDMLQAGEVAKQVFAADYEGGVMVRVFGDERPQTQDEVALLVLRRKILQAGHDAPQFFHCTSDDLPDRHVVTAVFRVFQPKLASPTRDWPSQQLHPEEVEPQSGFSKDVCVLDFHGLDNAGSWHQYRTCQPYSLVEQKAGMKTPGSCDKLTTIFVHSPVVRSRDEGLRHLAALLERTVFVCPAPSARNVEQRAGFASLGESKVYSYFCLLMNSDIGNDLAEIAWLARSFDLGNAGNPPDGACGAPICRFGSGPDPEMLGMYSCLVADAPRKCKSTARERAQPDESFTGFVKVMRLDEVVLSRMRSRINPVDQQGDSNPGDQQGHATPMQEVFSSETRGTYKQVTLQRLSDCLCRIGDVEVAVSELRFTQNTVSTHFRDRKCVLQLAEDLRSNPLKAKSLPKIQVFEYDGDLYTLDNRRLFAMKVAGVQRILAEKVQVRRDLLNKKLTTTCSGRFVVFSNDASIPDVADFKVLMGECIGEVPNCSHRVEVTHMGSQPTSESMSSHEIVKILAKNRFPIHDHFQGIFLEVMRSMAYPQPNPSQATEGPKHKTKKSAK